ncbi:receptor-like cytosolic serine/threonine-protein kinase RBK2 isoform X2 [Elaeis guineensis]|uniref:non-specific serine/threonine protein kinase n=1 Tax=Elaeis guineensis var. tenera TaxID=51953 RepID=A0A6I9SLD4_ELAGV|nr:receptor-like cytosolic serine/threonine-protein kinase RBK2 [Elaeis guineensis]
MCLWVFSASNPMDDFVEEIGDSTPGENAEISSECSRKPPQIGAFFSAHEKDTTSLLSVSISAQDFQSLEIGKDTREATEVSSPRGVLDDGLRCLDLETSSSKTSTSCSETQLVSGNSSRWKGFFRFWKQQSMRRLSSFPPLGVPKLSRRKSNRETHVPISDSTTDYSNCYFKPTWKNFTISELQKATNNFSPENIIGKGGYAEVYKGSLENGQLVAIKMLTQGTADERTNSFLSELGIIVHVDHPNTAKLIGVGAEGGMYLVLQLSSHGSLETLLHGSKEKLSWDVRYKIATGAATGLEYLHERCQRRIIHRDIKAANVLLTDDFEPQICDFGLAMWLPDKLTHHTVSNLEGTFGYLAPEYCTHGIVDEKTDVYAFGVLLLELITGRSAVNSSQQSLVMWAKPLLEKDDIKELVDPSLNDSYDIKQVRCVAQTAYMCIQHSSVLRPRMTQVLDLLKGKEMQSESMKVLHKSLIRRTYSVELFDAEEYNATRYLNDLTQHKKLALDF